MCTAPSVRPYANRGPQALWIQSVLWFENIQARVQPAVALSLAFSASLASLSLVSSRLIDLSGSQVPDEVAIQVHERLTASYIAQGALKQDHMNDFHFEPNV